MSSIFEEQDNQDHEDVKLGRFIIGILIWVFIPAAILVKPIVKLSIRKKDK